ncbi:MAG: prepilin-type N-terminal cleavage/methylation domain-containing protein [Patescibacteria group bacterium]|nr:prepilin-type N-terminal cleavage/methylation domain-containing protein [Patescibacteria group bacterium]
MNTKGFTLVEMLIVLAIIGILTAVIIASTTLSRAKARDTRRIGDMKEIQLGLALYYDVNRAYPIGNDASALTVLTSQKYIPSLPTDPLTNGNYEYVSSSPGTTYCLGVTLEDAIPSDSASCTSALSGSTANYKAQPPQ